jgi:hypothetical protein
MKLRKFVACTVCVLTTAAAAAGCADGTGEALTPTLPSTDTSASNADGTKLKASAPRPLSPQSAIRVSSLTPQLVLQNPTGSFEPSASLSNVIELYEVNGSVQTLVLKTDPIPASGAQTTFTVPADTLKLNKTYAWSAYAMYAGARGSLSDVVSFRTPLPQVVDGPGPVPCSGNSGQSIIGCVAAAFPEKLVATSTGDFSLERRWANMEFLRDRIIETGKCKGMDLARNFKRGTPVISRDFIVLRSNVGQNGRDRGVDIASGYDAVRDRLKLTWQVFDADKNWGHPYYAAYGPVDCSGVS